LEGVVELTDAQHVADVPLPDIRAKPWFAPNPAYEAFPRWGIRLLHQHSKQDEFGDILQGESTLVTDDGEMSSEWECALDFQLQEGRKA
jgi:hypothetical protein